MMDRTRAMHIEMMKKKNAEDPNPLFDMILERYEQEETPKRIECNIEGVPGCEECGEAVDYKVIFNRPNNLMVRAVCRSCGHSWSLPHVENLRKRSNTTQAHWRNQVLKRDNMQCRICGSTINLEAHHIIPVSADRGGKYRYKLENGITLCRECHNMIPTYMKS